MFDNSTLIYNNLLNLLLGTVPNGFNYYIIGYLIKKNIFILGSTAKKKDFRFGLYSKKYIITR